MSGARAVAGVALGVGALLYLLGYSDVLLEVTVCAVAVFPLTWWAERAAGGAAPAAPAAPADPSPASPASPAPAPAPAPAHGSPSPARSPRQPRSGIPGLGLVSLGAGGRTASLAFNRPEPQAFETALFAGTMVFMVRTAPEDPRFEEHFRGRRRMLEVQVQGRFRQRNAGPVVMGAELPERLKLGVMSKGLAKAMMSLGAKLLPGMHGSLGSRSGDELAHMVFPLWRAADRMVVSEPGAELPAMGRDLPESLESRSARKHDTSVHVFDPELTYTFSFHTLFFDLPRWKMVNVPGMRDIEMATFVGEQPLVLVGYELRGERHVAENKAYVFRLEVSPSSEGDWEGEEEDEDEDDEEEDDHEDEEDEGEGEEEVADVQARRASIISTQAADEEPQLAADDASVALQLPGWLEYGTMAGRRALVYLVRVELGGRLATLFRTPDQLALLSARLTPVSSDHPSAVEAEAAFHDAQAALGAFAHRGPLTDPLRAFLRLQAPRVPCLSRSRHREVARRSATATAVLREGALVSAVWERYWREDWCVLKRGYLACVRTFSRKPHLRVPLADVLAVELLEPPVFPSFFFFRVRTLGRDHVFCCGTEQAAREWVDAIRAAVADSPRVPELHDPRAQLLHRATRFARNDVAVLNAKLLFLDRAALMPEPCALASSLLVSVLALSPDSPAPQVGMFLESTSYLKLVNLETVPEHERVPFYLNLFHALLLHAFLWLGPPRSARQWRSFVHEAAYVIGEAGDVINLAMLFALARYGLSAPRAVARFQLNDAEMAAVDAAPHGVADARVSLAANLGCAAFPPRIPVFTADDLGRQLDAAAAALLAHAARIDARRRVVVLPKACGWYQTDFAPSGSDLGELLRALLTHMAPPAAAAVRGLLADELPITVRFEKGLWGVGGVYELGS